MIDSSIESRIGVEVQLVLFPDETRARSNVTCSDEAPTCALDVPVMVNVSVCVLNIE